jgi:mono/diheme cytochrome c family protein
VSRFRTAELLRVSFGGEIVAENRLPVAQVAGVDDGGEPSGLTQLFAPGTAVRLAAADDGALVLHQRARVGPEAVFVGSTRPVDEYTYSNRPVRNGTVVWRDPCDNAVVHAALTVVGSDGRARHVAASVPRAVVPVDMAVSRLGRVVLAFAGEPTAEFARGPQVVSTSMALAVAEGPSDCLPGDSTRRYPGQVIAVAFAGEVELVQLREPARLVVDGQVVELGGESVRDTGHDLFHLDTGGAVACASCHPGGSDDGHVWHFAATRPVRTLPLEGMVGLAPYHRDGSVVSFPALMADLERQMASPPLSDEHVAATRHWLTRLRPPPSGPAADAAAIERGRALFESGAVGCVSCHQGELGTDGATHDLGGQRWETAPLAGVALRPPYLHDGRAADLRAAILAHPGAVALGAEELADLEAYVRSR